MTIREAWPSDADAIRRGHSKSIIELGSQAYTQEKVAEWASGCESADYSAAIRAEDFEFLVAEQDSDIVGFGSLQLAPLEDYEADVGAEVTGVYVHPSVAREGVGTRLYTELEHRARVRNIETVGLSASDTAVAFYEARDFERIREYEHEFSSQESTGVTGTIVEMKKEL